MKLFQVPVGAMVSAVGVVSDVQIFKMLCNQPDGLTLVRIHNITGVKLDEFDVMPNSEMWNLEVKYSAPIFQP